MENTTKSTPKDFFIHLLSILALYVSVGSFIALLFAYINAAFPDVLRQGYYAPSYLSTIRWSISVLVVVFAVYVWSVWFLEKEYKKEPAKRSVRIRKWLLSATLFIAGGIIIGDLVALIYSFLGGEITARFVLKTFSMLLISAVVFGYYFLDMKDRRKDAKKLGYVAIIIVVFSIVYGFFLVGSPAVARKQALDQRRVSDLQSIQSQVVFYWQSKGYIPENVEELRDSISGWTPPVDPETGESYEYKKTDELTFEICADFGLALDNSDTPRPRIAEPYLLGGSKSSNWEHGEGRHCFERVIDPELYPVR